MVKSVKPNVNRLSHAKIKYKDEYETIELCAVHCEACVTFHISTNAYARKMSGEGAGGREILRVKKECEKIVYLIVFGMN